MDRTSDTIEDGLDTIAEGAGLVFGGRIVKLLLLFLVQLIMARVLGASAYGSVVLATMVGGIGILLAKAGIPKGLTRQVPYHEDDPERARGVVKAGVHLSILTSLLVASAVFLGAPLIANRVFNDPGLTLLVRIAAIGIPIGVLKFVGTSIARGLRDASTHVAVRQILNPLAQVVFVGGLVVAGFGAFGAMIGGVLAGLVGLIAAFILARRVLPFSPFGPTVRMHRELLTFSLPLLFAAGMNYLVVQADTILIGVFLGSSDVGIYNVAFRLREIGRFFFYPVTFLLPPVLTRLFAQKKQAQARRIYEIASKWMVLLTTPVFLGIVFFPQVLIGLTFGGQYVPGATALRVLMIPIMVTVLLSANGAALIALGHNRTNLYVNVGAAGLNVLLNLGLIPLLGIFGAALASAASFIFRDIAFTILLYRWERLQPFSVAMIRPYLSTILLSSLGYLVFVRLLPVTAFTVVGVGLLFLPIYVLVLVVTGAFEAEDERILSVLEQRTGLRFNTLREAVRRLQG